MLTLTENAKEVIQTLTAEGPAGCGLRIATSGVDADGQVPSVTLSVAPAPEAEDEVIDEAGARVFVQPAAGRVLGDQVLDAQVDQGAQQVNFFVR